MKNRSDVLDHPPSIAGGLPPNFRSVFHESSLRDAEWLRLPAPGSRCPLTGLSRTTLVELGDAGKIVMKRIRKPHATRGIIIMNKQSLLAYLDSLAPIGQQSRSRTVEGQQFCSA
jgi:hypothetical protein